MSSIFSDLPNDIIISIIKKENERAAVELKYRKVIQELNKLSSRHCDLDEGYWYGPLRPTRGNDIVDLVVEFFDDI